MTELPRRRLLAGTGTALAGLLAGCSSSADDDDDGETDSETDTDENETEEDFAAISDENGDDGDEADDRNTDATGTVLGDISIENVHSEDHTVDIIVEFDGEIEHWTTHNLAANDGTTLERDWPTEPGSFRVMARLDDGELSQVKPARWNDPDCLSLVALIDRDGELRLLGDTDSSHCEDGESAFDE